MATASFQSQSKWMHRIQGEPETKYLCRMLHAILPCVRGKVWKGVDVACGRGAFTKSLASAGFDMTGVDVREEVAVAKKRVRGAKFVVADMRQLSEVLPNDAYDFVVVMRSALVMLDDEDQINDAVAAATRLLVPGHGILVLDLPNHRVQRKRRQEEHWKEHGFDWDIGQYWGADVVVRTFKQRKKWVETWDVVGGEGHYPKISFQKEYVELINRQINLERNHLNVIHCLGSYYGDDYIPNRSPREILICRRLNPTV